MTGPNRVSETAEDLSSRSQWSSFITQVESELATGERGYLTLYETFGSEHALTAAIARGLRRLYQDTYPNATLHGIHSHVIYRDGDTDDRPAWTGAQDHKWTFLHGVRFVPDVLVRTLDARDDVLPVEVKLITNLACSQDLATAIGQGFAYAVRYPRSIIFVGVTRGLKKGRHGLSSLLPAGALDEAFHRRLKDNGVRLIFREVGILP